jgi:elongation factor P
VVDISGEAYIVKHIDVKTPSARGAVTLYKVRFSALKTKQKHEASYKGNDLLNDVTLQRKPIQYLYPDGDFHVFMDTEEYSQHMIPAEDIQDELVWLTDGMEGLVGLIVDGRMVAVEVPASLAFEITETAPGMRGASATARTKPALLENGVEIQVPEYLETGDRVKVNTETRKFISRA